MEDFDCIAGIDQIYQLVRGTRLTGDEHDHLTKYVGMIRQRLVRCDELEADACSRERYAGADPEADSETEPKEE